MGSRFIRNCQLTESGSPMGAYRKMGIKALPDEGSPVQSPGTTGSWATPTVDKVNPQPFEYQGNRQQGELGAPNMNMGMTLGV